MSVRIINCDVMEGLRQLPDESVQCVVTSPPYWGLRDYGAEGQIGLEPTLGEHIDVMVAVFREVRRVLRKDGTLWLNYGDCYASSINGRSADDTKALGNDDRTFRDKPFSTVGGVLKPKDLCGVAWRLAIALQEDGWWLRQDIIWAKPNPMPESIKDRCTKAHEYIFLLTKSDRYHFDAEGIAEPVAESTVARLAQDIDAREGSSRAHAGGKTNGKMKAVAPRFGGKKYGDSDDPKHRTKSGNEYRPKIGRAKNRATFRGGSYCNNEAFDNDAAMDSKGVGSTENPTGMRNKRSVWIVATQPFSEAHFATFPPDLIEPCIKAGCPKGGTVLDPFGGAGTTGLVADRLERNAILIELNPEYAAMAHKRIEGDAGMFSAVTTEDAA